MPTWGQLGCNGFIVLDGRHDVVSPCTKAFMQVRNVAFRDVESKLNMLLAARPGMALPSVEEATESLELEEPETCTASS